VEGNLSSIYTWAILMSGYSIEGEAQFLIDAGAKGFIPKPFDIEILLKTVEDALK
jgi:DNA-binding NtrC family response regulator